ncbi:proheparin-binding EGF-like growth factor [Prinia subflava]|uniref:proheparin-binding EGF-like growth factor n=1 Tax=Prinia subflava TaxID=208062 RepID=UPI002FE11BC5
MGTSWIPLLSPCLEPHFPLAIPSASCRDPFPPGFPPPSPAGSAERHRGCGGSGVPGPPPERGESTGPRPGSRSLDTVPVPAGGRPPGAAGKPFPWAGRSLSPSPPRPASRSFLPAAGPPCRRTGIAAAPSGAAGRVCPRVMDGRAVLIQALLAAVCSAAAGGLRRDELHNEVLHKGGGGGVPVPATAPLLGGSPEKEGGGAASGDDFSELPRVAFLSKPQGLVTPKKKGNGNKRRKGKGQGKKRDPCLRKYKDFCIHGECKYIRELGTPSCICQPGYHGERCHGLLLPVEHPPSAYDHTTALAVVAVVLSSLCLLIIAALLMLRCHKRGGYDVENEEKIKLGITVNH